jgi:hypothetical protein
MVMLFSVTLCTHLCYSSNELVTIDNHLHSGAQAYSAVGGQSVVVVCDRESKSIRKTGKVVASGKYGIGRVKLLQ